MPNSNIFIIGGEESSTNVLGTVMKLNENQWSKFGDLNHMISRHCAVLIDEKTIILIGGHIDETQFSDKTLSFDTQKENSEVIAARLNKGRQLHSCAIFDSNTIIVVGGRDQRGGLKSVETFNFRSSNIKWIERRNLKLDIGISYAQLVPNPSGYFFNWGSGDLPSEPRVGQTGR